MEKLVVVCLLGDPKLQPVSVKYTGGFQVDVQELLYNIKMFNVNNLEIHIITNTTRYSTIEEEKEDNIYYHRIQFLEQWLVNQNDIMKNINRIKTEFFKIIENILCERIIIHSFYWLSGFLAFEAKKRYGIPYVHTAVSLSIEKTLNGSKPYYDNQFEKETEFLGAASCVFSITNSEKEQLLKYYDMADEKVIVVGRGADPAFLYPCHALNGLPKGMDKTEIDIEPIELFKYKWWSQGAFTYVGRLQTIKGLHYIICAWLQLYEKYGSLTPPLWICGGTPNRILEFKKELSAFVEPNLLNKCEEIQKVVWWGYLDASGLSTLYLKTKALITHSQYEPGGRVLLEAFAASVPVVATYNGFAKDMINNENGVLVEYGDIDSLKSAMELFIKQDEVQQLKMKRCARKTFEVQLLKWNCYRRHFEIYYDMGLATFKPNSL